MPMIVTVTLNAAIDRTLTVPNFQRGQRHRASAGAHARRRQGDQRRARAEGARRAGRRDRPRRRQHRHAHRRGADRRGDPQRLRAHRGRVAHVDRGRRPDRRHVHRDQRVGAGGARPRSSRCCSRSSTTSRRAPSSSSSPARCRATSPTTSTPRRSATSTRRHVPAVLDSEGEPLRLGVEAEPFLVSPNQREAEALVGQEFHDDEDFRLALDSIAELGARNVLITTEDGCVALLREERETRRCRARRAAGRAGLDGRRGRRAARRRSSPRGTPAARRGGAPRRGRGGRGVDARGRRRPLRPAARGPPAGRRRGHASSSPVAEPAPERCRHPPRRRYHLRDGRRESSPVDPRGLRAPGEVRARKG